MDTLMKFLAYVSVKSFWLFLLIGGMMLLPVVWSQLGGFGVVLLGIVLLFVTEKLLVS